MIYSSLLFLHLLLLKIVTTQLNKLNVVNPPVIYTGSVEIGIPHLYLKIYESYHNNTYATNSKYVMINLRKVKIKIKQMVFLVFHFKVLIPSI